MLGLGWTEMLVIGVVALIFIGPKDLPVVMGKVGKVVGQIQRMGREFQREINKTTGLDEVRNLRTSITSPLKQTADEIRREFNAIGKDGQQTPSGAIKPTDPKVESVVDAIHEKAGIAAPAKKSNDELASEYGFKGSTAVEQPEPVAKPEPVKAARKRVTKPAHVATADGVSVVNADTEPAQVVTKPKPRKRAATTMQPVATEATPVGAPKKPRAPRKKPADTAGES